jgi:hypothetical protein
MTPTMDTKHAFTTPTRWGHDHTPYAAPRPSIHIQARNAAVVFRPTGGRKARTAECLRTQPFDCGLHRIVRGPSGVTSARVGYLIGRHTHAHTTHREGQDSVRTRQPDSISAIR